MSQLMLPGQFTIQPRDGYRQQWAADRLTLLDVAVLQGGAPLADLIDETAGSFPEVTVFGIDPMPGTIFKQLVRTKKPTVSFRDANRGVDPSRSTYVEKQFECFIFNPRWECDKAVADRAPGGAAPVIAEEAAAIMEASFEHIGNQLWYGAANDPKGFPGAVNCYDVDSMEVDATGTTAGQKSSVWGFRLNRNQTRLVLGNNGQLEISELDVRDITDPDGKRYEAYVQSMLSHLGLVIKDIRSVGRIKNITGDSGKTLTDDLIMQLILKFPTNQHPDVLFMNKVKREQLRQSRKTDLNENPPIPTESHGIPIVCTDALIEGETI